jgi:hypothetical protein
MSDGLSAAGALYGFNLDNDRRRDLVDRFLTDLRARVAAGLETDLARSYELLAAERALLDALIRNSERMVRLVAEVEATSG